jgi:hypothetical protein
MVGKGALQRALRVHEVDPEPVADAGHQHRGNRFQGRARLERAREQAARGREQREAIGAVHSR